MSSCCHARQGGANIKIQNMTFWSSSVDFSDKNICPYENILATIPHESTNFFRFSITIIQLHLELIGTDCIQGSASFHWLMDWVTPDWLTDVFALPPGHAK